MVVRLGGCSTSVTCFSITNGMYQVVDNIESAELGGDMFTEVLAEHFANEFLR